MVSRTVRSLALPHLVSMFAEKLSIVYTL